MPKITKELPDKAQRFNTLTQIVLMSFWTGEYRDPGFKEEIGEIVDIVMAEELTEIKRIADNERAMLRDEMALIREKAMREIDDIFNRHMIILEIEVKRIFAQAAASAEKLDQLKSGDGLDLPRVDTAPAVIAPQAHADMRHNEIARELRMERLFGHITQKPKL